MQPGQSLLEVGCGTGRNLAQAIRLYPGIRPYGLDISDVMLATARKTLLAGHKLAHSQLIKADAAAFNASDFDVAGFDRIMISYALSMIPEWQATIRQAISALNPGGSLHIADFGQQEGLPFLFKAGLQAWLRKFHVSPRADLREVLEAEAVRAGARLDFRPLYRGYAWIATIRS
jgi:S-adenosylmethionine-diacylgycerolhomoserine-N-methlytransferase